MPNTITDQALKLMNEIRALGCAVVIVCPEDLQTLTADDDTDEPTISEEDAAAWLRFYSDEVEQAILGDYWGDTIRDLMSFYKDAPLNPLRKPVAA